MFTIYHDLQIGAPAGLVFSAVSTPAGLNTWWTRDASGQAEAGEIFRLYFGDGYDWRAEVVACEPPHRFCLRMTSADADWLGTSVSFDLRGAGTATRLRFEHAGWAEASDHFRQSSFCWATYLETMKRQLERAASG